MKKKLIFLIVLLSSLICLSWMLFNPLETILVAKNALTLWKEKLFPSLFPFLVLGELLILLDVPKYLSIIFERPFKFLFNTSGTSSFIILMSMISGFPSGPKYIMRLYNNKEITKEEGNRLLQVVHFSNPLFILGTVYLILKDKKVTYFVLIAHIISNFIVLFLSRRQVEDKTITSFSIKDLLKRQENQIIEVMISFLDVIKDALNTMLFMLGSITFFMLLSSFITKLIFNTHLSLLLTGFLDLTSGILKLGEGNISLFLKGLYATCFISFGSLSVHVQVLNVLKEGKLAFSSFLKGRIKATIIASLCFFLGWIIYGCGN